VLQHNEQVAKTLRKAEDICRRNTLDAVKLIGHVVRDPHAKDSDRLKAAGMILDRVWGRAPEHVTVDVQQPRWVDALRDVLVVGNDEQASHHEHTASAENAEIIDAEIVDEDPIFE
jgi:hypothetical protein